MPEGARDPEARLRELGYGLPPVPTPAGSYVPAVRVGGLVFTAGQIPLTQDGGLLHVGRVGAAAEVSVEQAQEAARLCVLNALAAAAGAAGGLSAVRRVVRVTGYVASAEGFRDQPRVLNAASELLGEVFGEAGRHARSAVGVAELPLGAPVEIELVVEVAAPLLAG